MSLKSPTATVTLTEWESRPFVPITVTVYSPTVVEVTVRVDVPDVPRMTLVGFKEAVTPQGAQGATTVLSVTVPVNRFRLVTVIVAVSPPPTLIVKLEVLVDILKSMTSTLILRERETPPLAPITVTE